MLPCHRQRRVCKVRASEREKEAAGRERERERVAPTVLRARFYDPSKTNGGLGGGGAPARLFEKPDSGGDGVIIIILLSRIQCEAAGVGARVACGLIAAAFVCFDQ